MDPDALGSAFSFPPWVVCLNSLTLYQEKVSLPEELKLSKKTLRQIRAVREWAARENKSRQADFEASNDLPPTTPQTAPRVEVAGSARSTPPAAHAFVADPATLAMVARLKRGPRIGA